MLSQYCVSLLIEAGKRFLELLRYSFRGVDVNSPPGPAHIREAGFRGMDQPHPKSLLELTPALKRSSNAGRGPQSFNTYQWLSKCF